MRRVVVAGAALALTVGVVLGSGSANAATVPIGQPMTGKMTFYNDVGFGACGTQINAATQNLVAMSFRWWTTPNPNNDPICQGISVRVTFNGKTITVPVKDKCPSCDATHIDLSQAAFQRLAPLDVGVVNGITWQFVNSGGGNPPPPGPPPPPPPPPPPGGNPPPPPPPPPGGVAWQPNVHYSVGQVVTFSGRSYSCVQSHTSLPGWEPPNVPALWAPR